jgi:hypothetical protein
MNEDYFTRLDEQLSELTMEGAHLDRRARWRPLDRVARRTVEALALVVVLAALLVIEFPGSASGSVQRATPPNAVASISSGPLAAPVADRGQFL